jgi:ribonuclease Z
MGRSFDCTLVNGPFGDPALYVRNLWEKRALLFDMGELHRLRPSQLLKTGDIFISHTHVDHFIGFDHFLRTVLNRDKTVNLYGPGGLAANVAGKLKGYTWNLVEDYRLNLRVHEIEGGRVRRVTFSCRDRFRHRGRPAVRAAGPILVDDDRFEITAAALDHSVPSLAYALRERTRTGINRDALERLGWATGPWLGRLKGHLRRGGEGERIMNVPLAGGKKGRLTRLPGGEIAERIVIEEPGASIGYVTDVSWSTSNRRKIVDLVRNVDVLYCEAAFMGRDADHARRKHHLTTLQAGRLAREAGVRRLEVFHFSPKYLGMEEEVAAEARAAMEGRLR